MVRVIVEPDSTGGWFALVGVVAGVLLTSGVTWLQGAVANRKGRRRRVIAAADSLRAGAKAAAFIYHSAHANRESGGRQTVFEWVPLILAQAERIQRSFEVIDRDGPSELSRLAAEIARLAIGDPDQSFKEPKVPDAMQAAIKCFSEELRKFRE